MVCAGSGGVGKTTIAAATAVRAAHLGLRTLVLTVDPARRLATALGLDLTDASERPVAIGSATGSLSAAVIDSKKVFDQFILEHAENRDIIARIMKNRLYQQLSTTLSGSQEFTALERLLQATESGRYDLVVLDTPPTKHAMDFLTAPDRINSLFQDSVTRWFMVPGERVGLISGLLSRGTRIALKALENLTGAQFIEELLDFFGAIRSLQKTLRERSERIRVILKGEGTRFFVVTSFDAAKLLEAQYLQVELKNLGYKLSGVVINRAFPLGIPAEMSEAPASVDREQYEKVFSFYQNFKAYYAVRYGYFQDFAASLPPDVNVLRLPEFQRDVYGIEDLERVATLLGEGGIV